MNSLELSNPLLLSVILPVRNEAGILWQAAEQFAAQLDALLDHQPWEFVFVENGSSDQSPQILQEIQTKRPSTQILTLPASDYGNALRAGILTARGAWIMILNVDHYWDSPCISWAWRHRQEYDLILGSKRADPTLNQQNLYRRFLSAALNGALQFLFDFVGSDSHGMKLLRTDSLRPIAQQCVMRRGQFDTELTLRALRGGFWLAEIPIPYLEKRAPRNFMIRKVLQNVYDLIRFRRVMREVPYVAIRYRRFCRDDLLNEYEPFGSFDADIK